MYNIYFVRIAKKSRLIFSVNGAGRPRGPRLRDALRPPDTFTAQQHGFVESVNELSCYFTSVILPLRWSFRVKKVHKKILQRRRQDPAVHFARRRRYKIMTIALAFARNRRLPGSTDNTGHPTIPDDAFYVSEDDR
ncbi:hypothetical protein EVAR_3259_1 [Eumeta japonica]|uniref:Uncharacterized protein n=1 Tax=Eumeta variegata TaxID=151549 RepID=A0A4C1SXL2_EUMVA|nr:hypothetical protein EVAR_3259_1 [Eumeta japonica]